MIEVGREERAQYLRRCRLLVSACVLAAGFYVWWLLVDARAADPLLFRILVTAELFNICQSAGFWYTIWNQRWRDPADARFSSSSPSVDLFVTICGEPPEIVGQTVAAAAAVRHPNLAVWVLDDGPSATVEEIAKHYGARYVTRPDRSGAKAGNINHALSLARGEFVAVFDADHAPLPAFLVRTMSCFDDPRVAFVQTPQWYRNRAVNRVAAGAQEQQELFYGPILRGKDGTGAVFSCGTNVVFRRSALEDAGRVPEDSITEDLRLSLLLVRRGWKSVYVPEILAHGLGPFDVTSYFRQQMRWARGGLEILMRRRPFSRRMSLGQSIQYTLSFLYWFTGFAYLGYLLLPPAFLLFGLRPVQVPNQYPAHFLPYVVVTLLTMIYASGFSLTFRAVWFTLASFPVHISAFFASLFGRRVARFRVTPKAAAAGSLRPVWPHLLTLVTMLAVIALGLASRGPTPSVMNNVAFALGHILIVSGFVFIALRPEPNRRPATAKLREQAGEAEPLARAALDPESLAAGTFANSPDPIPEE